MCKGPVVGCGVLKGLKGVAMALYCYASNLGGPEGFLCLLPAQWLWLQTEVSQCIVGAGWLE